MYNNILRKRTIVSDTFKRRGAAADDDGERERGGYGVLEHITKIDVF